MDIRKIALYLSGKIPPNYEKYNRLEFMELLNEIFGYGYDKLDFYWKQSKEYEEEFYFMVLDLLYSKGLKDPGEKIKFDKLINDLKVEENRSIEKTKEEINYVELKEERLVLKEEKNAQKKGKLLELFLKKIFNYIDGFNVVKTNLKLKDQEFDLVVKNDSNSPFIQNIKSPVILVEAKNWSNSVQAKEVSLFRTKVSDHISLVNLGIFVSVNGFTKGVSITKVRSASKGENIILITGKDIEELFSGELNINQWFENKLIESIV